MVRVVGGWLGAVVSALLFLAPPSEAAEPTPLSVPILLYHRLGPALTDEMTVTTPVFESQLRMVYVAAEDGMVSIFGEDLLKPGNLRLVTNPNAGPNAHSIGLDTESRHVYLPTANIRGVPVLREMFLQALPEPDD